MAATLFGGGGGVRNIPRVAVPSVEFCDRCQKFGSVYRGTDHRVWRDAQGKRWCQACWNVVHPGVPWTP